MASDRNTEKRIFEAAKAIFHERGYHGARMQEIARRAGINQSMLHYYFRSKEGLFEAVFRATAGEVLTPVFEVLSADLPLSEKLDRFVEIYIDQVSANPYAPGFLLEELSHHPDHLRRFAGDRGKVVFEKLAGEVREAVVRGELRPISPEDLFANLVALCLFPFIARPILQTVTGLDDDAYRSFLRRRKREVRRFIHHALKP